MQKLKQQTDKNKQSCFSSVFLFAITPSVGSAKNNTFNACRNRVFLSKYRNVIASYLFNDADFFQN